MSDTLSYDTLQESFAELFLPYSFFDIVSYFNNIVFLKHGEIEKNSIIVTMQT